MKLINLIKISCLSLISFKGSAQSNIDANAISQTDIRISQWASGCVVDRGWLDIADKSLGNVTAGADVNAVGPISAGQIVSLGDSGVAVVTFTTPIRNLEGPDFAVFENGFLNPLNSAEAFLELAFVEVSSDGINYVRFPAQYLGEDTVQKDNFTYSLRSDYENLAGNYVYGYGTPFDLDLLKDSVGINVDNITHIRIVDVVGSLDTALGSSDASGRMINDPYPSAFASGGFDLSGIAVLNAVPNSVKDLYLTSKVYAVPNPAKGNVSFYIENVKEFNYQIVNVLGNIVLKGTAESGAGIDVSNISSGSYYGFFEYYGKKSTLKFVKE